MLEVTAVEFKFIPFLRATNFPVRLENLYTLIICVFIEQMVLVLLTIACSSEVMVVGTSERFNIRKRQEKRREFAQVKNAK